MEYLRFGRSNLMVSRLSLGAMGFGDRGCRKMDEEKRSMHARADCASAARR